jgi:hypothetical protein
MSRALSPDETQLAKRGEANMISKAASTRSAYGVRQKAKFIERLNKLERDGVPHLAFSVS